MSLSRDKPGVRMRLRRMLGIIWKETTVLCKQMGDTHFVTAPFVSAICNCPIYSLCDFQCDEITRVELQTTLKGTPGQWERTENHPFTGRKAHHPSICELTQQSASKNTTADKTTTCDNPNSSTLCVSTLDASSWAQHVDFPPFTPNVDGSRLSSFVL